jgi:hypothetical protein
VKRSRLDDDGGSEQTWAGCLVLFLTAFVAAPGALGLSLWLRAAWPWPAFPIPTALVVVPTVALGLAFYFGASAALHALGFPTWRLPSSGPGPRRGEPPDGAGQE